MSGNYASIHGLNLYYEIHGEGNPVVLLHGGFGSTGMFAPLLPELTAAHQVIAVDLQGHGRTADIDRPLSPEAMGDDVAALIKHLGLTQADLVGYSMGAAAALRAAIQHPEVVRKLAVISFPSRSDAWYPELMPGRLQMGAESAEFLKETPMYQTYASIAPRPEDFPRLCAKVGEMLRRDYNWADEIAQLKPPTLLVVGDADGCPPSHAVEFFALLGGGLRDGHWDRSGVPQSQLAILPSTTHYDILYSPTLLPTIMRFLDEP